MIYPKPFFALQVEFAHRVCAIGDLSLERALFEFTNLYVRFGLGRDFDEQHSVWQAYLAGLRGADDASDWSHEFYRQNNPETVTSPALVASFGCFSYAVPRGEFVRLHFRDVERDGHSALSVERIAHRRADLTALFTHVKQTIPQDIPVVGISWLYNLGAYRRLFPTSYTASAQVVAGKFRSMTLWGQFLNRQGEIKEQAARTFRAALHQTSSIDALEACFPFRTLTVRAPVREFYSFYEI